MKIDKYQITSMVKDLYDKISDLSELNDMMYNVNEDYKVCVFDKSMKCYIPVERKNKAINRLGKRISEWTFAESEKLRQEIFKLVKDEVIIEK